MVTGLWLMGLLAQVWAHSVMVAYTHGAAVTLALTLTHHSDLGTETSPDPEIDTGVKLENTGAAHQAEKVPFHHSHSSCPNMLSDVAAPAVKLALWEYFLLSIDQTDPPFDCNANCTFGCWYCQRTHRCIVCAVNNSRMTVVGLFTKQIGICRTNPPLYTSSHSTNIQWPHKKPIKT